MALPSVEALATRQRASGGRQPGGRAVGRAVGGRGDATVLSRAMSYRLTRLGSLDAIHPASADPFRAELSAFVTYDQELAKAAADLGFPVAAPS